jgi:broad specificity phosphatase PhoE
LIRHGATENNLANPPILQGRNTDPPLSSEGISQAKKTGAFLADVSFDRVYSSPLLRAKQTAREVARLHGVEVENAPGLIEVDVGRWEGMDWETIESTDPETYRLFMEDPTGNPYSGGETIGFVQQRARKHFQELLEENLGKTIAVVAHNVVNRAWLAFLMGIELPRFRVVPQHNCGISLLRYRDGKTKILAINGIFHLSGR